MRQSSNHTLFDITPMVGLMQLEVFLPSSSRSPNPSSNGMQYHGHTFLRPREQPRSPYSFLDLCIPHVIPRKNLPKKPQKNPFYSATDLLASSVQIYKSRSSKYKSYDCEEMHLLSTDTTVSTQTRPTKVRFLEHLSVCCCTSIFGCSSSFTNT